MLGPFSTRLSAPPSVPPACSTGSRRRHWPRSLLRVLVCLVAAPPLPAEIQENSSDGGQSPGRCAAPRPAGSWTFCPGSRSGGLGGGALGVWVPGHSGLSCGEVGHAGGRAVLAAAFLGQLGGQGWRGGEQGSLAQGQGSSPLPPEAGAQVLGEGRTLRVCWWASCLPGCWLVSSCTWKEGCWAEVGGWGWAGLAASGPGWPCSWMGLAPRSRLPNPQRQALRQPRDMFVE